MVQSGSNIGAEPFQIQILRANLYEKEFIPMKMILYHKLIRIPIWNQHQS